MRELPERESHTIKVEEAIQPSIGAANLAQLIAAARANVTGDLEHVLLSAQAAEAAIDPVDLDGTQYLLFACAGLTCAVPLTILREVLPALPSVVPLPYSPDWLLGIFPLRSEMLGLADPAAMLLGQPADGTSLQGMETEALLSSVAAQASPFVSDGAPMTALVVGTGERSLAWAVTMVGAIVLIRDGEISIGAAGAAGSMEASSALPVAARYCAGIYTSPDGGQRIVIVRAETLLDDLLSALEEGDESHG